MTQLARAVEYTDCISAAGWDYPNECPDYDTKQSDGEALVILKIWEMQSIPSLPLLPGLLWPGVVAPVRVLSMSLTFELSASKWLMLNWILEIELFDHLTVCKQMTDI